MASLLTAAQKNAVRDALGNMHDTFGKTIYVYVEEAQSVATSIDYNPLYRRNKDQGKSQLNKILKKYEFKARVYYQSDQKQSVIDLKAQTNLIASEGVVRIKIDAEAYNKIKICSRIEINNILYVVASDLKLEDQINELYYTVYLKREN